MSHRTERDAGPFQPKPSPSQEERSQLSKRQCAEMGTPTPPAGHTRIAGPCPSVSTPPAPTPDSWGTPIPPSPSRHSRLGKNVKEKTKKTPYLTPTGQSRAGGIYLKYSIKHTTSGGSCGYRDSRATRHHLQLYTTRDRRHGSRHGQRDPLRSSGRCCEAERCWEEPAGPGWGRVPPSGLGDRGPCRADTLPANK